MSISLTDEPTLATLKSPERVEKLRQALERRQPTLAVVIENIHDPHNFNAILRSCDAVGVSRICLVYTIERPPRLAPVTSSGAYKWMDIERFPDIKSCFETLHLEGFRILATKIDHEANDLFSNDLSERTAFVLGNEHRGISEDVVRLADELIYIPMMGMSESLNVSVASAVCLFEAMRQRKLAGMYDEPQLSPEALRSKLTDWLTR
jgi:tRNA (guanosine-2'-O-)-methyltransferase